VKASIAKLAKIARSNPVTVRQRVVELLPLLGEKARRKIMKRLRGLRR